MKLFSFVGKGGVGKTTSAAALALKLSKKGKVLVISLDPAHNLGDVLNVKLSAEPKQITHNLWAAEPDVDEVIRSYTRELAKEIKAHYKYLRVLNLDKLISVLELSPGVEEQALLEELIKYLESDFDYLVVDHAPTGIAVRVLSLPSIMLMWINSLIGLRKEIIKKEEMLKKIRGEETKTSDPVLKILEEEKERMEKADKVIRSPESHSIYVVLNPEELPVLEALRIKNMMMQAQLPLKAVVVNKYINNEEAQKWYEKVKEEFAGFKIFRVPKFEKPPKGLESLEEVSKHIEVV